MIRSCCRHNIFEIKPKENNYNLPYRALTELAREEKEKGLRPEYIGEIDNLSSYSTVFIGSPVWWGDFPMIMYTFFEHNDLNGKTLIPFATHEGSGLAGFDLRLKDLFKSAKVLPGLALKGTRVQDEHSFAETEVKNFLSTLRK